MKAWNDTPGLSAPLGATVIDDGVNFSVFSKNATSVDLLLFDDAEAIEPSRVVQLTAGKHRTYHYWHVFVPELVPGQIYAYRAHGPFAPERGLRFDGDKVRLDPYGLAVAVPRSYDRKAAGIPGGNAAVAMKSVVADPSRYDCINFVTCHDGFTLNDLVSYNQKHNEANGEHSRDGADDNISWNCGVEGPTDDPAVEELRNRQIKNFIALLMLSAGTPMLLMGDDAHRTQGGNNNAYCLDDETSWSRVALAASRRQRTRNRRLTAGERTKMAVKDLEATAQALVADSKGLLAADETVSTLSRRLVARGIESTPDSRRAYREMLFSTPGIGECISGVILHEETIRQRTAKGRAVPGLLAQQGIVTGIKVDRGASPLSGASGEHITDGLDGLRDRLRDHAALGARFAKWRAVIVVSDTRPTRLCLRDNAHALGRYASICQEQGVVPIVEAEVMTDGTHTIERCEEVTGAVLREVLAALADHRVALEGILLKPNMVLPGAMCPFQAPTEAIAAATVRCLRRFVPAAVPGIVFLSGGQDPLEATARLSAINQQPGPKPWKLTFSFGRALQDEALCAWGGWPENAAAGQRAFRHRVRCVSSAAAGQYFPAMEEHPAVA